MPVTFRLNTRAHLLNSALQMHQNRCNQLHQRTRAVRLTLVGVMLLPAVLRSQPVSLLESAQLRTDDAPVGWVIQSKTGTPRLRSIEDGGVRGICLASSKASFSINRTTNLDPNLLPKIRWKWRVNALPERGDFRDSDRDDQAAQLFVAFQRTGLAAPKAINYIWDSNAPVGTVSDYDIPLVIRVKTVVVANGAASKGEWKSVTRDVAADYRRFFGGEPPRVGAIRFQVNSQHTSAEAEGCLSEVAAEP
jgi:hypothetical protein